MKFYVCEHCGNVAVLVQDAGASLTCCGQKMKELQAVGKDGATEKHVPVVEVQGDVVRVSVGSVPHPMTEEHLITWIAMETNQGFQVKKLTHQNEPSCVFLLSPEEKLLDVYSYCNLHGLWKA